MKEIMQIRFFARAKSQLNKHDEVELDSPRAQTTVESYREQKSDFTPDLKPKEQKPTNFDRRSIRTGIGILNLKKVNSQYTDELDSSRLDSSRFNTGRLNTSGNK